MVSSSNLLTVLCCKRKGQISGHFRDFDFVFSCHTCRARFNRSDPKQLRTIDTSDSRQRSGRKWTQAASVRTIINDEVDKHINPRAEIRPAIFVPISWKVVRTHGCAGLPKDVSLGVIFDLSLGVIFDHLRT